MKRIHLFEFEDQEWFPKFLRNYMTDFLQFLSNKAKIYSPIIPLLTETLQSNQIDTIVDLASGGGGGLLSLNKELKKHIPDLKILLTDYYPNIPAFERTKSLSNNFEYLENPVDARNVSKNLKGFRSMFLSFHHFRPHDAKKILQNAIDCKMGIGVFEVQDRSMASIIGMLLSPLSVILTTPFIRPFKISRIFFTYLIPIVPLCVLWDGLVSCFRTYSSTEMESLVNTLENKGSFNWKIGSEKEKATKVLYLVGTPKKQ